MSKKKTVYCWDSSVFLAWLKAEECHPLAGMELVADEITSGKAAMLFPATVYEEIYTSNCPDAQKEVIESFLRRSDVMFADLTPAVARKSAEIISFSKDNGFTTKKKDARIAATAVVFRADVLHSVDNDLLRLSGTQIVDGMKIEKPRLFGGQKGLL